MVEVELKNGKGGKPETITKETVLEALERGEVSYSVIDQKTGERLDMMVANRAEAEESAEITMMANRLRAGHNCDAKFLNEVADKLTEIEHDRSIWRGRMKFVICEREKELKVERTLLTQFYCIAKDGENGKPLFYGTYEYEGPGCPGIDVTVWREYVLDDHVRVFNDSKDADATIEEKDFKGRPRNITEEDRASNLRVVKVGVIMVEEEKGKESEG